MPRSFVAASAGWSLLQPLTRPVVLAQGSSLLVAGGLDSADSSTSGVLRIATATGAISPDGTLALPTHDAGGATLGGRSFVIGGGSTTVYDQVQQLRSGRAASVVATLPQARADLTVAQGATSAYVVGGYSGTAFDPAVLATTNGVAYRQVGALAVPVRYAAAVVAGGTLWVFGGLTQSGADTADVQAMNLRTGVCRVVGTLGAPLDSAGAAVLDGTVLVVGGRVGGSATGAVVAWSTRTLHARQVATLPTPVSNAGVVEAAGRVWVLGGEQAAPVAAVQRIAAG